MKTRFLHYPHYRFRHIVIWLCMVGLCINGCDKSDSKSDRDYLIKVGNHRVTVPDFNKALDFARTAYPHSAILNASVDRSVRVRLMNQLTEELILMNKADELSIAVSDEEVDNAIAGIKKDYPDNTFEETFLENAVSYDMWRSRLKIRLLMEKVVASELENKIKITPEDISQYYSEHYTGDQDDKALSLEPEDINENLIKSIRRKKAEDAYKVWMKSVQKDYKIEINKQKWDKLLNS